MNLRDLYAPLRIQLPGATEWLRRGWHGRLWRVSHLLLTLACALGGLAPALSGATLPAGFAEERINGPTGPTWPQIAGVTFGDNGRIYVWERAGRVWFQEYGQTGWRSLIDIAEEVGAWNDHGCLGFAIDPNFRVNGHIYLMYAVDRHHLLNFGKPGYNPAANEYFDATIGRITRYTARATDGFTTIDYASRKVLIGESATNGMPILHSSHGVGSLVFGTDGTLLVSCGDGASWASADFGSAPETYYLKGLAEGIITPKENVGSFRAQMVNSLAGKILRIDPATGDGIPSNPFYDPADPRAARSKVWAFGVRNPCRMTLRPESGSHVRGDANPGILYVGDVGWGVWEEINVCRGPGQNFGWPTFEGIQPEPGYANYPAYSLANVQNLDAPNPLYPGAGCSPYFRFNDLVRQHTTAPSGQPPFNNPCAPGQKIPAVIPQFLQTPPAMEWIHRAVQTRTWIPDSNGTATPIDLGTPGSPVSGSMFPGNCSIAGAWYTGTNFPTSYRNTYFHADHGANWIKRFVFDASDKPVSVSDFIGDAGGVLSLAVHPMDGSLYYISWSSTLKKVTFPPSGNLPPTAIATADRNFGQGPLTVQFTGQGSSDPEGLALTFDWDFGDGTPHSSAANPSHVFSPAGGGATRYDVTLKVTDTAAQSSTIPLVISVNNTPPRVTITSPVGGSRYSVTSETIYHLTADVFDSESTNAQLQYEWRTYLHHNNHEHQEPVDTNHTTTSVISPAGCDGINIYYYRVELTVTDPAGLSTTSAVSIFPECGIVDTPPQISSIPDQLVPVGQVIGPLAFTVSDAETAPFNLEVSGASSNPRLVPPGSIVLAESGNGRTVTIRPATGESGTARITLTVTDGPNVTSTQFLVTVPVINPTVTTLEDTVTTLTLPSGAITGVLTYSIVSGPTNGVLGALNPGAGTATYTPKPNFSGQDGFMYSVSNGTQQETRLVKLTVTEVNDAPVLAAVANRAVDELYPWSVNLAASDADLPAQVLTYSLVSGPTGLAVTGGGLVTWTPTEEQGPGTYPVTVRVTDNGQPPLSDSKQFTLAVNEVTTVWQIGTDDNPLILPYRPHGEFSPENGLNDIRPGRVTRLPGDPDYVAASNPAADDDLYIAGVYGIGFNGLLSELRAPNDEPAIAWERALTSGDRTNRVHFMLGSSQVTPNSRFRLSFEFAGGGASTGGFGDHDVAVRFKNGSDGSTQIFSQRVSQTTNIVVEFLASTVGASAGPNTVEFVRTGPVAAGVSSWILYDVLRLEAIPIVNTPPILTAPLNLTVDELAPVSLNLVASDADLPAQSLSYSLVSGPEGLIVSPAGVVTWTPTELQGPSVTAVTVSVTDNGTPPLSATAGFSITVRETNAAPALVALPDQTIDELAPFAVNLSASDIDRPTNSLTYALVGGPEGLTVSPTGLVSWSPTELQGPSVNSVTVSVTDNGTPPLSATAGFSITVREINAGPMLVAVPGQTIDELVPFAVNLSATDGDRPANLLIYALVSGPEGLTVSPTGVVSWTPTEAQGPSVNAVTVSVTDNGSPAMTGTGQFQITVREVPDTVARTVWQIGIDDSPLLTPYFPNGEFSAENGRNDVRPGVVTRLPGDPQYVAATNPGADDDFYFAGTYPLGFNGLPAELRVLNDEPPIAWERAHTQRDRANRLHFVLGDSQVAPLARLRLSFELAGGGTSAGGVTQPGFGDHDLTVLLRNGSDIATPIFSQRVSQRTNLVIEFLASAVGASVGPNTIEIDRTGPALPGVSYWANYDYLRLEALPPLVNTPPILTPPSNLVVDELASLVLNLSATDSDVPAQILTYSLITGPEGLTVSSGGQVIWTPTEAQGPGSYGVEVQVTDSGLPPQSDRKFFTIVVNEVADPIVRTVWQIGTDDNPLILPYQPYVEFSPENTRNDLRPGKVTRLPGDPLYIAATNPGADDDFYFLGFYPLGFNGLLAALNVPNDEPPVAWERALTVGDRTNRVHFVLGNTQITSATRFRLTFELVNGSTSVGGVVQPGFGDHDILVQFRNGSDALAPIFSQRVSQKSSFAVEFLASAVGASSGPNTIEFVRSGPAATGVSAWTLFDYVRLEIVTSGGIALAQNQSDSGTGNSGWVEPIHNGILSQAGLDYLTLTYEQPDPAPEGVLYVVEASEDLVHWSPEGITPVSESSEQGWRTITVRSRDPLGAQTSRFMRLRVVTNPRSEPPPF